MHSLRTTALLTLLLTPVVLHAQYQAQSYSDYYRSHVVAAPNTATGTNAYLYNKYFTQNPAVSPYVSGAVMGSQSYSGTAYLTTTLPEIQRRESMARNQAQYVQQRKLQGNVGYTMNPGGFYGGSDGSYQMNRPPAPRPATNGAYQNHWYGSWNR